MTKYLLIAFACLCGSALQASVIVYTATGTAGGQSVDATISFQVIGTNLIVGLTNDESNPTSSSQEISDFSFALSGASGGDFAGTGGLSVSSSTTFPGSVGTICVNNTTTCTPGTISTATHWTGTVSSSTYSATTLSGGQPNELIIGGPGSGGTYSNANGGVANFDPYIGGGANNGNGNTVYFEVSGITNISSAALTSEAISFGTGSDAFSGTVTCTSNCSGTIQGNTTAPEPWSLALMGGGLFLLGLLRFRRANSK